MSTALRLTVGALVALLAAPLVRNLGERLLDVATGHRAAHPIGDPLLEDTLDPAFSWLPGPAPSCPAARSWSGTAGQ